jgi:hypothetical protein
VKPGTARWIAFLLCAGCAASGRNDRPPAPGPAPSPGAIHALGYEGAVKAGSDYVVASTGVTSATVNKTQTLPSGMLELTFDLGPGVPEPMRVVVDPNQGKVQSLEPVQQVPVVTDKAR